MHKKQGKQAKGPIKGAKKSGGGAGKMKSSGSGAPSEKFEVGRKKGGP